MAMISLPSFLSFQSESSRRTVIVDQVASFPRRVATNQSAVLARLLLFFYARR